MLGVMFGSRHSFYDMDLLLKRYPKISPPLPRIKKVEVPGMDGELDISKALTGHLQFNRRTIEMEFTIMGPREEWPETHSEIMDALHGEEMEIVLDDDPEYCYTGTLSVSGFDPQKVTSGVTITADVEPYKTRREATRLTFTASGSLTETIIGKRKPVCPLITASAAMQMTFGGVTYALAKGENLFPDVVIRNGENTFTFKGTGSVTLEYREGRF